MIGVGKNSTHNYNVGKKKKKNNLEFKTVRYRVASENHCIKWKIKFPDIRFITTWI